MSEQAFQQQCNKYDALTQEINKVILELQENGLQANELKSIGQETVNIENYTEIIEHYITFLQTIREYL